MWAAFPAPSERQMCKLAAQRLGMSERTARNAIQMTHDISGPFALRLAAYVASIGKDPFAIAGIAALSRPVSPPCQGSRRTSPPPSGGGSFIGGRNE